MHAFDKRENGFVCELLLAENEDGVDGLSEIWNVTDDLNQLLVKQAEPLNQIISLNK